MYISEFTNYNTKFYLMFDGKHYAVFNNYHGLIAYSLYIDRQEENIVNIKFVIPDLLPCDTSAITKAVKKEETQFIEKEVNVFFEKEANQCTGYTTLQKSYLTMNINER